MSRHEKKRKKGGFGRFFAGLFKSIGTLMLVGVLSVLVFACIFAIYVKNDLSNQVDFSVEIPTMNQTSTIYCQDRQTGQWVELQKLYDSENRIWVEYDKLPRDLINACIAIEDKRFYEHAGVDWITTGKACAGLFLGNANAGGSTITQQLIKNITGEKEVTVRRKIVEIFRALDYEKNNTKPQILEQYMNIIYMGEGCYGVQSAARVYFGKNVWDLTLAECASLIGITNNPSIFDPYINPEKNRERQLIILNQMLEQEKISRAQYDEAVAQEMVFTSKSVYEDDVSDSVYYSYFVDQVIRDVTRDLAEKGGISEAIATKMLYGGGYKIYCTMDPDIQKAMEETFEDLNNIPNTRSSQQLQSAMVTIDNETGDVVGIIGGVGEKAGSLDWSRATQSTLSPGSTIKPISVYAPALDLGLITPSSVYDDTPLYFDNGQGYPRNQSGVYEGLVSVNYAVGQSLNTVPIKLVNRMGPAYCYTFAKDKMGLSTLVADVVIGGRNYTDAALAPMSMGGLTYGVTVRDMTAAYAALANGGNYRTARTYTRVTDGDGTPILENEQLWHSAIKSSAAWYMTYMLENTTITGTAVEARMEHVSVAAKTGTTTGSKDRWFAGYTPYYTGVVWCGYDDPEEIVLTDSTTNPALKLWKSVMDDVHEDKAPMYFQQPADVINCTYCRDSGLLATDACRNDPRGSRAVTRLLFRGDVPAGTCDVHVNVPICSVSGNAATEFCALYEGVTTHTVGLLDVERTFSVKGVSVTDQPYTTPENNVMPESGWFLPAVPENTLTVYYCTQHDHLPESVPPTEPETPETPAEPEEPPARETPIDPSTGMEMVPDVPEEPEENTEPEDPTTGE